MIKITTSLSTSLRPDGNSDPGALLYVQPGLGLSIKAQPKEFFPDYEKGLVPVAKCVEKNWFLTKSNVTKCYEKVFPGHKFNIESVKP